MLCCQLYVDDSEVETEAEGDDLEEEIAPLTDQE